MNVRQKFFALAGVAGLIMAVVSVVGFFTASDAVKGTEADCRGRPGRG